jgi:ComEC/Rec2-related protein
MIALKIIFLSIGYILGIVLASMFSSKLSPNMLIPIQLIGLIASVMIIQKERHWKKVSPILTALAVIMFILPFGYRQAYKYLETTNKDSIKYIISTIPYDTPIKLRGQISEEGDIRSYNRIDINLKTYAIQYGTNDWVTVPKCHVKLRVKGSTKSKKGITNGFAILKNLNSYGYQIEVTTEKNRPRPTLNPHQFDNEKFIAQSGYMADFQVSPKNVTVLAETRGNPMLELALAAKRVFLSTYRNTIQDPASRLVSAATLGTRRAVEKQDFKGRDISQMFRHVGIGHVLAVSGLHVTVISVLLYFIFASVGLKPKTFAPILIFFLLLFAMLTGARPSSMRAVIMNSIIISSIAYFKLNAKHATYIGLSLSSLIILIFSPLVLFSASFLLSFGAVLSLVLITPTVEKWIKRLRGFSLIFAIMWFSSLIYISCINLAALTRPENVFITFGVLWLSTILGTKLNNRFPKAWRIGTNNMPEALQMFIAAQVSIQLGMMIPMSAYFFGQFPIAGIFVNLIIIPAIGVLVQLGMLAGLLGLIPLIGSTFALPLGASATVVAYLFFWVAYIGSNIFPYPTIPKPTIEWLLAYYAILAIVISSENWRHHIQAFMFKYSASKSYKRLSKIIPLTACLIIIIVPIIQKTTSKNICRQIIVAAQTTNPVVIINGTQKTAMINAANQYTADRILFNLLRGEGACQINDIILTSANPNIGISGIIALSKKMPIRNVHLGLVEEPGKSYLETIGDEYLITQANKKSGGSFQRAYNTGYIAMTNIVEQYNAPITQMDIGEIIAWDNMQINNLPLDKKPKKYIASAKTAIININYLGKKIVVITETSSYSLRAAFKALGKADIIIITDQSNRSYFMSTLKQIKELSGAETFIFTSSWPPRNDKIENWCKENNVEFIHTGIDGMVRMDSNNGELNITTLKNDK